VARGGARTGAGRKPGALTTKTREIAEKATAEGITPLDYMLSVLRDETAETAQRFEAAKAAAPYIHPRLAAVEHSGPEGGPIQTSVAVEFVEPGDV
jgi:hypothetical protein